MKKYVFDWDENCEYLLKNHKCFTSQNQYMEQVAFIRYLYERGETDKERLYKEWRKVDSITVRAYKDDEEELREKFEELYEKAMKLTVVHFSPIKVYQEEIDFINQMEVVPWIKEYILTMLVIYKYYGVPWCRYNQEIKNFCYSATQLQRERSFAAEALADCIAKYNPYSLSIYDAKLGFKVHFVCNKGKVVGKIRNPSHVQELFELIINEKVCEVCGKKWEYSSKTVHNTKCPDCVKKERYKKQNSYKKYNRELPNGM